MKKHSEALLIRMLTVLALGLSAITLWGQSSKPFTIPEVAKWQSGKGRMELSGKVAFKSKKLYPLVQQFIIDFEKLTGKSLEIRRGKARVGDISFSLVNSTISSLEAYQININQNVSISAPSQKGLWWASRTLLQFLDLSRHTNEPFQLDRGYIKDVPAYEVRGLMLDVGRKYIPIAYLYDLIDVMSYYKMNTLQLHLNDNAFKQFFNNDWNITPSAFRLESTFFPGLTAKDGAYSKKELKDLQQFARKKGVTIIPEIDAPAHSLAFTHYRPQLASKKYGADHLDLFNPETYTFLDSLYQEYLGGDDPVFEGPYVNIGTDEYSNADQKVVEKFRFFTDHYLEVVQKYGKKPLLWGALTHAKGSTPVRSQGVTMNMWYNGYADPKSMKELGYKMISIPDAYVYIVPAAGYYYDFLNIKSLYNSWTPAQIGNVKFEEKDPAIKGGMFAIWNDHYGNGISVKDIHYRLYPALQTLATKCWTGANTVFDYQTFNRLRNKLVEAPGINALGRLSKNYKGKALTQQFLSTIPVNDLGFYHEISFEIECKPEDKGAILSSSANGIFYLSDPKRGHLGFARDGYLNTFNYVLPNEGKVKITIQLLPKETVLYVNGKLKEKLSYLKFSTALPIDLYDEMLDSIQQPIVYKQNTAHQMNYVRTLFFPLTKIGNFKSKILNIEVAPMTSSEK